MTAPLVSIHVIGIKRHNTVSRAIGVINNSACRLRKPADVILMTNFHFFTKKKPAIVYESTRGHPAKTTKRSYFE
jgi:hypothetical protein